MLKKLISIIKEAAILYCAMFTVATLVNSMGAVWFGIATNPDVHGHIILRSGIVLALTIIILIMKHVAFKGSMKMYIIICAVALVVLIIYNWAFSSGYLWVNSDEVHPNAFRDFTRSVIIPFVVFAVIVGFIRIKLRKKKNSSD